MGHGAAINVSAEIFQEPEGNSAQPPSLMQALQAGGIFYRVDGKDEPAVLRAVVDILRLPEEVDREFLYQVLLAGSRWDRPGSATGLPSPMCGIRWCCTWPSRR